MITIIVINIKLIKKRKCEFGGFGEDLEVKENVHQSPQYQTFKKKYIEHFCKYTSWLDLLYFIGTENY